MNPHRVPRIARVGFTLVEVMVALFIMAIMAGLAWRGIDGIMRARTIGRERMEQTLRLGTVMTQWEQDVQALVNTGLVPPIAFDGATMRMSRRTEGGVQIVAWSLRGGEWLRWAGAPVTKGDQLSEQWMRSQQLLGTEADQLHALKGVAAWQAYFCHDRTCWSNAQSTGDTTEAPQGPAGPAPTPPGVTGGGKGGGATPGGGAPPAAREGGGKRSIAPPSAVRIVLTFSGSPLQGTLTRDIPVSLHS